MWSHACVRDGHASHALAYACAQEIMDMLRPLTGDEFTTLVTNFYTGLKGRFKIPIFAHHELDLHAVRGCAPMRVQGVRPCACMCPCAQLRGPEL